MTSTHDGKGHKPRYHQIVRFLRALLIGVLALSLAASPAPVPAEPVYAQAPSPAYVPGQLIVRFRTDLPPMMVASAMLSAHLQTIEVEESLDLRLVAVTPGQELELVDWLSANPLVAYVGPNYIAHIAGEPNDPAWWRQWNMRDIGAPQAWDYAAGDGVIIAVLDTGVDASHPELSGRLLNGYDFVEDDAIPQDDHGHGTHVAGIAAASGNNGVGIAGLAPQARLLPLRVLDAHGDGSYFDIIQAIRYAADHGARVVNLSLGGAYPDNSLREAVQYAASRGCLVVAAAGNQGGAVLYPAAYPEAFAVAATDDRQLHPAYSNYGAGVDIAAPGGTDRVGIYSLAPGGGYSTMYGTSMSTPHVAGLAALLWSLAPSLSPQQITAMIEETASPVGNTPYDAGGWNPELGHGLINAPAAVQRALAVQGPTPSPSPTPRPPAATPTSTTALRTVTLSLNAGWNLVSFNVQPVDERLEVLTGEIAPELEVILGFRCGIGALSYYPTLPPDINTLQSMQGGRGYWVKMRRPRQWHITGRPIPPDAPLSLCQGWNLAGFLPDTAMPISQALAPMREDITAVMGFQDGGALSYYADLLPDLNTLREMRPGHAYWISTRRAGILTYGGAGQ